MLVFELKGKQDHSSFLMLSQTFGVLLVYEEDIVMGALLILQILVAHTFFP